MSNLSTTAITSRQLSAALIVGTIGVLMVGIQPILLGELVGAKLVSMEGVGIVAMAEIVTLGLGVVIGDALLPPSRLKLITIVAALLAAAFDMLTIAASGDGALTAVRAAAGLPEGILIWGATGVVVRTRNPSRVAGIFFVIQTIGQASIGALLAMLVIPRWGWQGGFLTLGLLKLLPCLLAFVQPAGLAQLMSTTESGFRWSVRTARPLMVAFLQLATLGSFWAYLEPIGKAAGLDAGAAQTLISGVLAMQVLGGCVAALLVRHVAVAPTLLVCSILLAGSTVFIHQLHVGSTLQFCLACALFGFVWLFMLPFHVGLAFRADASGRVASLIPAAQLLGSAFGPLMASFMVDGENASTVPLLSAGFGIVAMLVLLAAPRANQQDTHRHAQTLKESP